MSTGLEKFIKDQLSVWPLASANFRSLKNAEVKKFKLYGIRAVVQHNPCRIASSTAETDEKSIASRACFLCADKRPEEQFHIKFQGRKQRRYNIQVNPYPIFRKHLVIVREEHIPQSIWHHLPDMLEFTSKYPEWTVFYNGPESGASAPDHLHFQACERGMLPLETAVGKFLDSSPQPLATNRDASIHLFPGYANGVFAMKSATAKSLTKLFYRLLCCCSAVPSDKEPKFNIYVWNTGSQYRAAVVMRSGLRSHHYTSTSEDHLTMSPGAADVAGWFVVPVKEDFDKLSADMLEEMIREVTPDKESEERICRRLSRRQQKIKVRIKQDREIFFEIISDGAGRQKVGISAGRLEYNGVLYDILRFEAVTRSTLFAEPSFIIYDGATSRRYAGSLEFRVCDNHVEAICIIGVEDYLLSIISRESTDDWDALAVRTRSEILRQWEENGVVMNEDWNGSSAEVCDKAMIAVDGTWGTR